MADALVALVIALAAIALTTVLWTWRQRRTTPGHSAKPRIAAASATGRPGPAPSNPQLGNLGDAAAAGSLHEYLVKLHREFGEVAWFWWGTTQVVSLASPTTWRGVLPLFDRPVALFQLFQPLIGDGSIQYNNGARGQKARRTYMDPAFSHAAVSRQHAVFAEVIGQRLAHWSQGGARKEPARSVTLPASASMNDLALRTILLTAFGADGLDDGTIESFRTAYNFAWHDMETRLGGSLPEPGSQRAADFHAAVGTMRGLATRCLATARVRAAECEGEYAPRSFVEYLLAAGVDEETARDETITMIVGGFHTTGSMLTWLLYFLAAHPDVQDRARAEVHAVLGDKSNGTLVIPSMQDLQQRLPYITAVLNETLRASVLAPWAARESDRDVDVPVGDGSACCHVPAGTPMILALGVMLYDEHVFPEPGKFDPGRFLGDEAKAVPSLAFSPFGFAGKRICPGQRVAMTEAGLFLCMLLQAARVRFADPEAAHQLHAVYGLVSAPSSEFDVLLEFTGVRM